MSKIIGRTFEQNQLEKSINKNGAQLIVIYGRRRVGKTFLINEFFNNKFTFKITGIYNKDKDEQLRNFQYELEKRENAQSSKIADWYTAFNKLRDYIESLNKGYKKIIFFDEMPWLDSRKSDFISAFEYFWNDYAITNDEIIFIVCGSSSSWICDKFLNNKGGLFNRHTLRMFIEPFNLYETELYMKENGFNWSRYDIAQIYMILGGIPYYLNLLDNSFSLNKNIDNLFFKRHSLLFDEFDKLYNTLFKNDEYYKKIVIALSNKRYGMTKKELSTFDGIFNNGYLSNALNNLINSGFVRASIKNGDAKETVYSLSDYFTIFYLKYVKDNYSKDEYYWENSYNNPSRYSWCGLAFEQVCFDHLNQLRKALGINGILTNIYSFKSTKDESDGVQIDLVLDRKDNVLTLLEIKYSINEYEIDKDYYLKLLNKINYFLTHKKNKSIQLVLISTIGLKNNMYSNVVNNSITLDDLFIDNK